MRKDGRYQRQARQVASRFSAMRATISDDVKPEVASRRKYLRPDKANRLIGAASERGRYGFRDKTLLRMTYRHGLRASEAWRCAGNRSTWTRAPSW